MHSSVNMQSIFYLVLNIVINSPVRNTKSSLFDLISIGLELTVISKYLVSINT